MFQPLPSLQRAAFCSTSDWCVFTPCPALWYMSPCNSPCFLVEEGQRLQDTRQEAGVRCQRLLASSARRTARHTQQGAKPYILVIFTLLQSVNIGFFSGCPFVASQLVGLPQGIKYRARFCEPLQQDTFALPLRGLLASYKALQLSCNSVDWRKDVCKLQKAPSNELFTTRPGEQ